jgi:predicted GNAT superfamily acetyltransferase
MSFSIRPLTTLEDCRRVAALEREVWGYADAEDVVPAPVLIVSVKRGGILLGAFDADNVMKGFVYSMPAIKEGRPTQWSHMLGVTADVRSSGLGARLKLAQRQVAMQMGLELIEWTFDPLQALNAHLNFTRLGVVCDEYVENLYGESTSALHRGTPTDRFVVEWWLRKPHVERRIDPGSRLAVRADDAASAPMANRTGTAGSWCSPMTSDLSLDTPRLWVEIPPSFTDMQQQAPELAREWRFKTREIFQAYFGRGYRAVDFELQRERGGGRYLLARQS